MIGMLYYANSVASSNERRCAYVVVRPKEEPFAVHTETKPDDVKEGLTKTASLRCSGAPETGNVLSLAVTKRGSMVAMVTTATVANVMDGSTNTNVTGRTDKDGSNMPFIELIWRLPSKPELQVRNTRILILTTHC